MSEHQLSWLKKAGLVLLVSGAICLTVHLLGLELFGMPLLGILVLLTGVVLEVNYPSYCAVWIRLMAGIAAGTVVTAIVWISLDLQDTQNTSIIAIKIGMLVPIAQLTIESWRSFLFEERPYCCQAAKRDLVLVSLNTALTFAYYCWAVGIPSPITLLIW
jgi:hypothetical protein